MKIQIKLSQADVKRNAMVRQGIDPATFGHRKASQAHRNKKAALRAGQFKHKGQMLAC